MSIITDRAEKKPPLQAVQKRYRQKLHLKIDGATAGSTEDCETLTKNMAGSYAEELRKQDIALRMFSFRHGSQIADLDWYVEIEGPREDMADDFARATNKLASLLSPRQRRNRDLSITLVKMETFHGPKHRAVTTEPSVSWDHQPPIGSDDSWTTMLERD